MQLPLAPLFLSLALALSGSTSLAAESGMIVETAVQHARLQTRSYPGNVTITPSKTNFPPLPECSAMEGFTPPGAKMMGRVAVGVRCLAPQAWSVLVPLTISASATYVTTTRPLAAGQVIQPEDLSVLTTDASALPTGAVSDPAQAIGKAVRNSLGAGQALRSDGLLAPLVIRQGQTVKVVSKGNGFAVSSEGKALGNAAVGQMVQIRMMSGQSVQGIARADGSVEISF